MAAQGKKGYPVQTHAFHPEGIVSQIKAFFSDVHDLSDFYYKLYLLNGLCRNCDGRGYLHAPDQPCPHCQGSGSTDVWRKGATVKRAE
jgi:RecJ-like exonuclease